MIYLNFDLKKFLKKLKLNEENISMFFGALVILVLGILIVNYFKDKKGEIIPANSTEAGKEESAYVVKKGDSLWKIAEAKMGTGFKWTDLKKANNLKSDSLEVGQKLQIPATSVLSGTTVSPKVTTDTYTVVKGDTLWSIAVMAYGDGYKWSSIAKANNLKNPNVIHSGNVLKLPR